MIDYNTFFTRLGKFIKEVNLKFPIQYPVLLGSGQGADEILDQFGNRRDLVTGLQSDYEGFALNVESWISTINSYFNRLLADFQLELNSNASDPSTILDDFITQMREDLIYVTGNLVSGYITNRSTYGNGQLLIGFLNSEGYIDERCKNQKIRALCTSDKHTGSNAGSEYFELTGYPVEAAESYKIQGDGNGPSLGTIQGNSLIANGDFENWTSGIPDGWTTSSGSIDTELEETNDSYYGDSALLLTGSASLLQDVSGSVFVDTVYAAAFNIKRTAAVVAGTSIRIYIMGTDMDDVVIYEGDPVDLDTDWELQTKFFILPKNPAIERYLVIDWDAGSAGTIPAGAEITIDNLGIVEATEFGRVHYAISRGNEDFIRDDRFDINSENDNGGLFQTFLIRFYDRFFPSSVGGSTGITGSGLPAGSTLISDNLAK